MLDWIRFVLTAGSEVVFIRISTESKRIFSLFGSIYNKVFAEDHIMIAMTMTEEGLARYDVSEMHKRWKAEYGDRIALKTIFDHE